MTAAFNLWRGKNSLTTGMLWRVVLLLSLFNRVLMQRFWSQRIFFLRHSVSPPNRSEHPPITIWATRSMRLLPARITVVPNHGPYSLCRETGAESRQVKIQWLYQNGTIYIDWRPDLPSTAQCSWHCFGREGKQQQQFKNPCSPVVGNGMLESYWYATTFKHSCGWHGLNSNVDST